MRGTLSKLAITAASVLMTLAACDDSGGADDPSEGPERTVTSAAVVEQSTPVATTVAETTETTAVESDVNPSYTKAQATLNTWAAAIGDVDTWSDTIGDSDVSAALETPGLDWGYDIRDFEAMSYLAATVSHAEFKDCRFSTLTSGRISAQCDLTLIDPILEAIQKETVQVTWQLNDTGKTILFWEPGNRSSSKNVFVLYATEHYTDEFTEACGADTTNYNPSVGWAFNQQCGEFTAQISEEVSSTITAAR